MGSRIRIVSEAAAGHLVRLIHSREQRRSCDTDEVAGSRLSPVPAGR